jgi:hypothetical protein
MGWDYYRYTADSGQHLASHLYEYKRLVFAGRLLGMVIRADMLKKSR